MTGTCWGCYYKNSEINSGLEPYVYLIKLRSERFYQPFSKNSGQSFTIRGKIVADATLVAVLGPTILSLKTDNNSGGTHFRRKIV